MLREKLPTPELIADNDLPIEAYRQEILDSVDVSPVVIIQAETGAGKSTQVPQMLSEAGYNVVVTQPRRIAARNLATRIADEMGVTLGEEVGFHLGGGDKNDRVRSASTNILMCTDGLRVVQELAGTREDPSEKPTVLVLDEVHEWNTNMETLIAWAKIKIQSDPNFKVVLMSATIDSTNLGKFFEIDTPVIEVPGRLFPVEKRHESQSKPEEIASQKALEGKNILLFMPGKKEIEDAKAKIEATVGDQAEVITLHGDQDRAQQQRAFQECNKPKIIISTNIAQTSVTIPGIDVVVDSGVEKRIEVHDGVEGLYLEPISQADCLQRAGRAGRTGPGEYILCHPVGIDDTKRRKFPIPEIQRSLLDGLVLKLAKAGLDIRQLDFFHDPGKDQINASFKSLSRLGAIDGGGQLTKTGRQIERLPLESRLGRMILEGAKHGCLQEVITVASCIEMGGIRHRNGKWKNIVNEVGSELIAELITFNKASKMTHKELVENGGIMIKNLLRAKDLRRNIIRALPPDLRKILENQKKPANRDNILKSCVAGLVDHVHQYDYGSVIDEDGRRIEIPKESIGIRNSGITNNQLFVGIPFTLSLKDRRGRAYELSLLQFPTKIPFEWLQEIAPHILIGEDGAPRYDYDKDQIIFNRIIKIGKLIVNRTFEVAPDTPENRDVLTRHRRERMLDIWLRQNSQLTRYKESDVLDLCAFDNELPHYIYGNDENGEPLKIYPIPKEFRYGGIDTEWVENPSTALSMLIQTIGIVSKNNRSNKLSLLSEAYSTTVDLIGLAFDEINHQPTKQKTQNRLFSLPVFDEITPGYEAEWLEIAKSILSDIFSVDGSKFEDNGECVSIIKSIICDNTELIDSSQKDPYCLDDIICQKLRSRISYLSDLHKTLRELNTSRNNPEISELSEIIDGIIYEYSSYALETDDWLKMLGKIRKVSAEACLILEKITTKQTGDDPEITAIGDNSQPPSDHWVSNTEQESAFEGLRNKFGKSKK